MAKSYARKQKMRIIIVRLLQFFHITISKNLGLFQRKETLCYYGDTSLKLALSETAASSQQKEAEKSGADTKL